MPRTRVKFCGVMTPDDARAAADAGADAVGMILHADAKRRIDLGTAHEIVLALPPYVATVGVFVNAPVDLITDLAFGLRLSHVQLHGDETPGDVADIDNVRVVKALKASPTLDDELDRWQRFHWGSPVQNLVGLLIDGPGGGGTGQTNDFAKIRRWMHRGHAAGLPLTVAGGLRPENVGDVVAWLRPYAVDTSSGIEEQFGVKSATKMRQFVEHVRRADASVVDV